MPKSLEAAGATVIEEYTEFNPPHGATEMADLQHGALMAGGSIATQPMPDPPQAGSSTSRPAAAS
ncbi:hypothetical protein [uncultured Sphingobium sp.]|uniref:hypothetical protein n=1 Tax=uncultured Sphingobium sp. TaxID=316087 RepID=UPI002625F2B4|nr:hypothetical protein [uncultured Sphingobium sp.]